MVLLKFNVLFFLISTGLHSHIGVAGLDPPFRPYVLGPGETLGDPFPNDTVYIPVYTNEPYSGVATEHLVYAIASDGDCHAVATAKGAHFYVNGDGGFCMVGTFRFPLCTNFSGVSELHVHPDFLSNGTSGENAHISSLSTYITELRRYFTGSYRIHNPTALYYELTYAENLFSVETYSEGLFNFQVALTPSGGMIFLDPGLASDPACHTNCSCGVPFLQFGNSSHAPHKMLPQLCGQKVVVNSGEELNILSHPRIGCEHFPNEGFDGYIEEDCRVNIRSDGPLKIRMIYANFVDNDNCDGFKIGLVVIDALGNKNVTKLCHNPIKEIVAPVGEGKINFNGKSTTGRMKYGFIINISSL